MRDAKKSPLVHNLFLVLVDEKKYECLVGVRRYLCTVTLLPSIRKFTPDFSRIFNTLESFEFLLSSPPNSSSGISPSYTTSILYHLSSSCITSVTEAFSKLKKPFFHAITWST